MNQQQKEWIISKSVTELTTSFQSLLQAQKAKPSEWVEWAKIWDAAHYTPPKRVETIARSVFKDN